jgi:YesN/AraC family two-component response regulator
MGMDEYIAKPIQMDELYFTLEQVTEKIKDRIFQEIRFDRSGNIQFNDKRVVKLTEEQISVLNEVSRCIEKLIYGIINNNLSDIETIAHLVKNYAYLIEADELKNLAFKIELAARRGNFKEAIEFSMQLKHEFDTFKKSV